MNLSCTKENLRRGLELSSRVAGRNTTLPILGNVLLRAERGGLTLAATNLEVAVVTKVRAKVTKEGALTVQARTLADLVQLLEGEQITLSAETGTLSVSSEGSETSIQGVSAEEFPIIPTIDRAFSFSVAAADLAAAINRTAFAAAQDSTRPEISGVYLAIRGLTLTLAATDSYRLAECQIPLERAPGDRSAIVPTRALTELSRTIGDDGQVDVFLTDNQALFSQNGTELTTRLIEGQYPDYQQIMPASSTIDIETETEALVQAIRGASLFCRPGINDVTLEVGAGKKGLTCRAANSEVGKHQVVVAGKVHGGEATIVFNYRYLLDGLANVGTEHCVLGITDGGSPGVLQPKGDQRFRYLIMPIRQ